MALKLYQKVSVATPGNLQELEGVLTTPGRVWEERRVKQELKEEDEEDNPGRR